ncbi:hypothetical protein R5R35_014245 [Gryllus longicercus]|uniref:HMG box domain-containing protein n=1 Tax=Gryllus longicercus TaxID=2509291 RepID=A0AAN9WMB5_9ORTH
MPPKKKKQAKNAFYYFLVEFKEEAVRNGRNVDSIAFEEEADREWRNLSHSKRLHYEEIALEKRKKMDSLENKFTTTGVSYAQLQREERERIRQEEMMIHEIESTVRSLTGRTLKTKVFHFIHVNTYCRLLDGHFLPCEIGIAKFTFENGVKDCYHAIIRLECMPTGYFLECQKHSEETHQIPLPPENSLGEWDSEKILVEIEAFLAENGVYPPVYTLQSNIEAAQDTLTTFASGKDTFRVYPIAKLLFELRNACANEAGGVGFPVLSLAEREFEKDFFNLSPGISCFYHEGMDACQYCSLSIVKRWCFLFASLGCPDLGVALKPGSHKPRKVTLPPAPPEPMTSKTQVSLRKGKKGAPTTDPPPITIIDYSSTKPSTEFDDEAVKTDSPLAQFGTYIRATAEENFQKDSKQYETSTLNPYSMHFYSRLVPAEENSDVLKVPTQIEYNRPTFINNENSVSYCSTKVKPFYSQSNDIHDKLIPIRKDLTEEQDHISYFQPVSYEGSSKNKLKTKQQQMSQSPELYSQFVHEMQDSISQNLEPSSEEPVDDFDIYVDSMFQPMPIQKQAPAVCITSRNVSNHPTTPWKKSSVSSLRQNENSHSPHQYRNQSQMCRMNSSAATQVATSSPQHNRSQSPGYSIDVNVGHGGNIGPEPDFYEISSVRPGREYFCNEKFSKQIPPRKLEEQQCPKNGITSNVRVPGRGRGRARGLSMLLE